MAYQFIHIEAVSRTGRNLYTTRNGEKINTGNISVDSVLGEAGRMEGYTSHIENIKQPVILYGNKENGIKDVRQKIKDWVDGTRDARGHKVRSDAQCLLRGVISWPPRSDDENKKEYIQRINNFQKEMIIWLKKEYDDDLALVLRHDDEPFHGLHAGQIHYHWHFFCVKKPGQKFDLHPGFTARSKKNISRYERENMSAEIKKEVMKEGMAAYRDAMVEYQYIFYEFAKFHGFERFGPRRLRRSRDEQLEFQKLLDRQIKATKEAEAKANTIIVEAEKEAEKIKKNAESEAKAIKDNAWKVAQDITDGAERNATTIIDKARKFVNNLLDKIDKIPGGEAIVKWARTFMTPKNNKENTTTIKNVIDKNNKNTQEIKLS